MIPLSGEVLVVAGTRPEVIKQAPLVLELRRRDLPVHVVSTGQHAGVLDPLFAHFGISPDTALAVARRSDPSLTALLSSLTASLGEIVDLRRPSIVVAQGDTTSALAAALAGFLGHSKVVHLEAGLRTGDLDSPFPEEANRRLITQVSRHHFAPTSLAEQKLLSEGVDPTTVTMTGNTVIDALTFTAQRAPITTDGGARRGVLVTAHRRESWGEPFDNILAAVASSARKHTDVAFTWVAHPNTSLRGRVDAALTALPNVTVSEPLGYPEMIAALKSHDLVLTDSGGLQEESPTFGVPVLVMRDTTERPEAVAAGCAALVGTNAADICRQVDRLLEDRGAYESMVVSSNPFGDGRAASRVADVLERMLRSDLVPDHGTRLPSPRSSLVPLSAGG